MSDRKAVFISGAASGIGLATAKKFASEGWFVGIADIDEKGMASALTSIGNGAGITIPLDVRDPAAWEKALKTFVDASGGRLDVMVNNAGLAKYDWFDHQPLEDSLLQIDVNVKGVIIGAHAALPYLRATPGARLINIASQASMSASPRLAVYSATKFAVRGFSEALDIEFMRFGVRVGCIMPTLIDTPLLDKATDHQGRSFRSAVAQSPVLNVTEVSDRIWEAAHGEHLHYGVGEGPEKQAEPLRAIAAATRERWKQIFPPR